MKRLAFVALGAMLLAAACGGDGRSAPDGAPPDAAGPLPDAGGGTFPDANQPDGGIPDGGGDQPDGPPATSEPSCDELGAPIATLSSFPATYEGDLAGAGANLDITDATTCVFSDAPAGQAGKGPDQVLALTGLTPGTVYFVKLTSGADLAAYVITGCDAAAPGPGTDQCLAYADGQVNDATEVARFIGPADGKAFLVVDYYLPEQPSPTAYTIAIVTDACFEDTDCTSPTTPFCDTSTQTCVRSDYCVGDDAVAEARSDDGPAGATPITLAAAPVVVNAHVCSDSNQFFPEQDLYAITVPDGGSFSVSLAWTATNQDELDLDVVDATLEPVGASRYQNPETVSVDHLAAGTYFARVTRTFPDSTEVTPYTISFLRGTTSACTTTADCAKNFQNQIFRPVCNAQGACVPLVASATVPVGGVCDDLEDCASPNSFCADFDFIRHANTRSICTLECTSDTDCNAVGNGFKCTTGMGGEFCLPPCTTDDECPTDIFTAPTGPAPWTYSTCIVAEGRCMGRL